MAFLRADIRVRHPGCFTEQIRDGAFGKQISVDPNAEVLVLRGPEPQVAAFWEWVLAHGQYVPEVLARTPTGLVLRGPMVRGGVVERILAHRCAVLWPASFYDGLEHYAVLAPSRGAFEAMVRDLGRISEVEVGHVGEVQPESLDASVTLGDIAAQLTRRQVEILRRAVERGYYRLPRETSPAELARDFGVSKSTMDEHLRKAERALVERMATLVANEPTLSEAAFRGTGRPKKAVRAPRARNART